MTNPRFDPDPSEPRRRILRAAACLAGAPAVIAAPWPARAAGVPGRRIEPIPLDAPQPMARLQHDGDRALLGVSAAGDLWRLEANRWRRLGTGIDPATPLANGHGRIAARARDGGLWLLESGRATIHRDVQPAAHAGMLLLAHGLVALARGADGAHHAVRLEPAGDGHWVRSARAGDPALPDARPVQFDPSASASDADGHVAVLAGPDASRYRHGVLGDGVEATALLLLERHDLRPLARLALPEPYVFEDIAPRPIAWQGRRALLTVRSGPEGGQLAVVTTHERNPGRLVVAALGEPLGTLHRWMSPITDGRHVLAVHTPHLGGTLHRYRIEGDRLASDALAEGVTNHVIGRRELDLSAWVDGLLVIPAQDRRTLRVLDVGAPAREAARARIEGLGAPVAALCSWHRQGEPGVAALLEDGRVAWAGVSA